MKQSKCKLQTLACLANKLSACSNLTQLCSESQRRFIPTTLFIGSIKRKKTLRPPHSVFILKVLVAAIGTKGVLLLYATSLSNFKTILNKTETVSELNTVFEIVPSSVLYKGLKKWFHCLESLNDFSIFISLILLEVHHYNNFFIFANRTPSSRKCCAAAYKRYSSVP